MRQYPQAQAFLSLKAQLAIIDTSMMMDTFWKKAAIEAGTPTPISIEDTLRRRTSDHEKKKIDTEEFFASTSSSLLEENNDEEEAEIFIKTQSKRKHRVIRSLGEKIKFNLSLTEAYTEISTIGSDGEGEGNVEDKPLFCDDIDADSTTTGTQSILPTIIPSTFQSSNHIDLLSFDNLSDDSSFSESSTHHNERRTVVHNCDNLRKDNTTGSTGGAIILDVVAIDYCPAITAEYDATVDEEENNVEEAEEAAAMERASATSSSFFLRPTININRMSQMIWGSGNGVGKKYRQVNLASPDAGGKNSLWTF